MFSPSSLANPHHRHSCRLYYINFILFFFWSIYTITVTEAATADSTPNLVWLQYDRFITTVRPPARRDFCLGFDWRRKNIYLFGGRTESGQVLDDTWVLDVYKFTWRQSVSSAGHPRGRYGAVCGMDQPKNQDRDSLVVALGKAANGDLLNDVWSFDLNNEAWYQVKTTAATDGTSPPGLVDAIGGIDSAQYDEPLTHLLLTGGQDVSGDKHSSLWKLELSGNYIRQEFKGSWSKKTFNQRFPDNRIDAAGTVLAHSRLAVNGGCTGVNLNECPLSDGYLLNYDDTKQESWQQVSSCASPRFGASMSRSSLDLEVAKREAWTNIVVQFSGASQPLLGEGEPGQVELLDSDSGLWSIVLPNADPNTGSVPAPRVGAKLIATSQITANNASSNTAKDLFLFGGVSLSKGLGLNDIWILRMFDDPKNVRSASAGSLTDSLVFLSSIDAAPSTSRLLPCTEPSRVLSIHVVLSCFAAVLFPVALSIRRYAPLVRESRGDPGEYAWKAPFTLVLIGSDALFLAGFICAFLMLGAFSPSVSFSHFRTLHSWIGALILLSLFGLLPLLRIVVWLLQRKHRMKQELDFEDDLEVVDSSGVGGGFKVLNRGNPGRVEEDLLSQPSSNPYHHPLSMFYREDGQQSVPVMTPYVPPDGYAANICRLRGVIDWSEFVTLFLIHVVVLWSLIQMPLSSSSNISIAYPILYGVYIAIIHGIWLILSCLGNPPESWITQKLVHGFRPRTTEKTINTDSNNDNHQITSPNRLSYPSTIAGRYFDESEEQHQQRVEQEMAGRDVMVVTVPKRVLTVANV